MLPGGDGYYPERTSWVDAGVFQGETAIVHGWPMSFLWRDSIDWSGRVWRPDPLIVWNFCDSVREFRLLPLIEDSFVALAAVGLLRAAVEWRRRRRRRALQFTLRELLIFVTGAAICLGWWGHGRAVDAETTKRLSKVDPIGRLELVLRLPLWLRACIGDKNLGGLASVGLPT